MAISFRSGTFQSAFDELDQKIEAGEISTEDQKNKFLEQKEIDPVDYAGALQDYTTAFESGELRVGDEVDDTRARTTWFGRAAGRAIGETAEGLTDFGAMILPDFMEEAIGKAADEIGDYIPDEIKKLSSEVFDPYHGEGLIAGGEEIVGTLGSYIVPFMGVTKVASGVGKASKALSSAGTRSLANKTFKKISENSKRQALMKAAGTGTKGAVAATIVEDPEEGVVNLLRESFPESTTYLERLRVDETDTEAEQYIKALLSNLGLGVAFSPLLLAGKLKKPIAEGASIAFKPVKEAVKSLPYLDKLPSIGANWSSRLGTDSTMLSLIQKVSKGAEAGMIRAEGLASDLSSVVKKEYKDNLGNVDQVINKALNGDNVALKQLKPDTQSIVSEMRKNVDELSTKALGLTKGKLKSKINKKLETYLTRSYDFFDDPGVRKQTLNKFKKFDKDGTDPDGVFSTALKSIMDTTGKNAEESYDVLKKLMAKGDNKEAGDFLGGLLTHGKRIGDTKSGMKRKDLPEGVRALLGEVKDPYKNYVKTMTNLSRIGAEDDFLKGVGNHLRNLSASGKAIGTNPLDVIGEERLGRVFGRTSVAKGQVVNPLEGLYVNDNYAKAIKDGLNTLQPDGVFMQTFMAGKGVSQAFKTAYNPATHGRNVMGNGILMIANGFIGPKGFGTALKATSNKLRNKTSKEIANRYARYTELGVASSGVNIGVIRRNLNAFGTDPDAALTSAANRGNLLSKITDNKVLEVYQAEDDLFKIAHFEKTLDYIKKSKKYGDLPLAKQEEVAAQRTRDLMPNYNLVPKALKNLRTGVLGDFLAFPAEMVRISKNLGKYTLQDIASGDKALAEAGFKRLGGLTAAGVAPTMLSDFSASMNGISSTQKEALENIGSDFTYNQDKIYLTPIGEDENGQTSVDFFNLGPIDPFSYLKNIAKGTNALVLGNITGEEAEVELDKIALGTLDQALGPFLAPSMITEALASVFMGESREGDTFGEDVVQLDASRFEPLIDVFTPGFVTLINKRLEYEKSLNEKGKKKSGAYFTEGEVDLAASLGLKRDRLDITAGTQFNINPLIQEINTAGSELEYNLRSDPNYARGLFSGQDSSVVTNDFLKAQDKRLAGYQKLTSLMEDYSAIYGDDVFGSVVESLTDKGRKSLRGDTGTVINNALDNFFDPYQLKEKYYFEDMEIPIDYDEIFSIYDDLQGSGILD